MPTWAWGLVGGLVGSGVILAVVVPAKVQALTARGAALQRQAEGSGALGQQVAAMTSRLRAFAQTESDRIAHQAADSYLASAYGLTQDRMQRLQALAQRLGVSSGSSSSN